ncbi:MAG: right-handed parallel beta-helix repeat-containing protein, partial [Candidatus Fermentibacteria bacterium]
MKYTIILAVLLLGCSNPEAPPPSDQTFYVSSQGDDSNDGSLNAPWKTIQYGTNQMQAGMTLRVMAGTYAERVQITLDGSTSSQGILLMNHGDGSVILSGSGITLPADWGGLLDITGSRNVTVRGITVHNVIGGDNATGILVDGSSDITILACSTWNTASSGIGVWDSDNVSIDSCDVGMACSGGEQECITIAGSDNFSVSYCTVHSGGGGVIGGEGIDAKDGSCNGIIRNNLVWGLDRLGIY